MAHYILLGSGGGGKNKQPGIPYVYHGIRKKNETSYASPSTSAVVDVVVVIHEKTHGIV